MEKEINRESICEMLDEGYKEWMHGDSVTHIEITGTEAAFISSELSKPEPFDLLQYLEDGFKVIGPNDDVFYFDKTVLFVKTKHRGNFTIACQPNLNDFFKFLFDNRLWPCVEPEPTPMELIEKARSCMHEAFGVAHGAEIDTLNAALDALEKSLEEKTEEEKPVLEPICKTTGIFVFLCQHCKEA